MTGIEAASGCAASTESFVLPARTTHRNPLMQPNADVPHDANVPPESSERSTVRAALSASGLEAIDAAVLLGHVVRRGRAWLIAHADDPLSPEAAREFDEFARRRREGEPVAYLTGQREFWGLPLAVSPAVLIPRPETELVVEVALRRLGAMAGGGRVLDLGTGSGAIALAIGHDCPSASVLATDASRDALAVARSNAERLGVANVDFVCSDWYSAVPSAWRGAAFDLIASNPPYIAGGDPHLAQGDLRFEPALALTPGGDGLGALRTIVEGARNHLVAGGTLVVEHGFDQSEAVQRLFAASGFVDVVAISDLAGIRRVVAGQAPA